MKCTALSWAAKWGIAREHRRLLGYHAAPGRDRMVDLYARDAMAVPLRELGKVISDIRLGRFEPDSTATGRFVPLAQAAPIIVDDDGAGEPGEVESESSEGSTDTELATDDEVIESPADTVVVQNCHTFIYHLPDGKDGLRCGKQWPAKAEVMSSPPSGAKLCMRCF